MKLMLLTVLLTSSLAMADTHYVDVNNLSPSAPYTNWNMAARYPQAAVDAASDGDVVLIADGHYYETETVVATAIEIRSVNGPSSTIIDLGGSSRGFSMDHPDSHISGLTIMNGEAGSDLGGGIRCMSPSTIISNCIIRECRGGIGGGVYFGTAINSKLIGNIASGDGGGMAFAEAKNCLFRYNHAENNGGGIFAGSAYNCTIVENSCGSSGGGVSGEPVYNSVVYYNININGNTPDNMTAAGGYYSCSPDLTPGTDGNITNAPLFISQAAGNFHLSTNSPCVDAGLNAYAASLPPDLDAKTRIVNARVDMGAYEVQPAWSGTYMPIKAILEKSLDMQSWTNSGHEVEWLVPVDTSNQFYRTKLEI